MNRANLIEMFGTPQPFILPLDTELKTDTEHPNLNSKEYRKKSVDTTLKIQTFFEGLVMNEEQHVCLACNDYNGRIWNGSIWGFDNIDDIGSKDDNSVYRLRCASPITDLHFVESNILLFSEANGSLQLWSTHSEVRSPSKYCLFSLGNQTEHTSSVSAIDIFSVDKAKAVSGSNDYCIKIWDMGAGDLTSILTLRNAHFGNITGVSSSKNLETVFVTCSRDKSVLMWDYRLSKPASGLYENHVVAFSTISHSDKDNIIVVGDEIGNINFIDIRKPKEMRHIQEVFNKPIHKIKFHGNNLAICGNTNSVVVFNSETNNKLYDKTLSNNFVRDICWMNSDNNVFYTADWDAIVLKHVIK